MNDEQYQESTDQGSNQQGSSESLNTLKQVHGIVKWFDPRKGFGFIIGPDEQDIFVHFTVIEGDGFRVLKDGAEVVYDAEENSKGWRATKIHRHEESDMIEDDDSVEVVVPRRTYSRSSRDWSKSWIGWLGSIE